MTIQLTLQYGGKYIHSVDRRGQKQRILMCKKTFIFATRRQHGRIIYIHELSLTCTQQTTASNGVILYPPDNKRWIAYPLSKVKAIGEFFIRLFMNYYTEMFVTNKKDQTLVVLILFVWQTRALRKEGMFFVHQNSSSAAKNTQRTLHEMTKINALITI